MASHFSTIGLSVDSEDAMFELVNRVGPLAEPLEAASGVYFQWADRSGAELWLQVRGNDLLGVSPHFTGQSIVRARLTARVTPGDPTPLDGAFHAWADPPTDESPENGAYPFVFDTPDARLHDGLELPVVVTVQVAAFAEEIEAFDSPAAHAAAQEEGAPGFASRSFIPSGLFTPQGDSTTPEARAILCSGGSEETWRAAGATGFQGYLRKPFLLRTLQETLLRVLGDY